MYIEIPTEKVECLSCEEIFIYYKEHKYSLHFSKVWGPAAKAICAYWVIAQWNVVLLTAYVIELPIYYLTKHIHGPKFPY